MKKELLKKIKLPDKPGVYSFKKNKEILYIGKATSLKDRVKNYFGKDLIEARGPIIADMVFYADKIDYQVTDSVLEALILEAELIKKYQPKYNTKEKSDKSFNYVCITKEKLPKVIVVRGKELKNQSNFKKIFGPYPNGSQLKEAMKIVRRIFPFLDEKSKNYLEFYSQINLVPDLNDRKLYLQNIKNIKLFFSGKKQQIFRNLKKEMNVYSKTREFEKAGEIKRQMFALKHINDVALIKGRQENFGKYALGDIRPKTLSAFPHFSQNSPACPLRIEAYDIAHMSGKNMVGVMVVVENGEVEKSEYKKFSARGGSAFGGETVLGNSKANDIAALKEVLERRLAHKEWAYPNLIVVDGGIAQINVTKEILSRSGFDIQIVSVLKDERHKPKNIIGNKNFILKYKQAILLANSEAHRFAIAYHKNIRNKNFLK